MSDYPDPQQPYSQPPPAQPYPQSAPTQFNPQIRPPSWQDQQSPPFPGLPQAPPVSPDFGFGQSVPPGMYLDQQSGLVLPQGTELATPGRRIGAFFLGILLAIVTLGIGYIIWGLIVWANGQTPALQVLGMRCYRPETNRVAGFWWMALREVVGRIADAILSLITELVSFIMMLSTRERRTLHDLVAGTVVLHDPNKVLSS